MEFKDRIYFMFSFHKFKQLFGSFCRFCAIYLDFINYFDHFLRPFFVIFIVTKSALHLSNFGIYRTFSYRMDL